MGHDEPGVVYEVMAWRIVKQPNGLLARFSDIVDAFTDMNMTPQQAYRCCREYCGRDDSKRKVQAGLEDWEPWTTKPGDGLARWRDSLETIEVIHGAGKRREVQEIGTSLKIG